MSDTDYDHISKLFTIIDGCVNHSGKFGSIQTEAFNELNSVNAQLRKKQMDKKAADEKAHAEKKAKEAVEKAEEAKKQEEANNVPAAKPRAIPSAPPPPPGPQFDLSGKPIEDQTVGPDEPTPIERRI